VQAWAEGVSLSEYASEHGYVSTDILAVGLYDIDLNVGNIKLRETASGPMPVIYDFNPLPQHLYAPNPLRWLSLRLGRRHWGYRVFAALESWANHGLFAHALHFG
jgi:hypothetical protein